MNILIVDDSATQRKLLQQLLKKGGFTESIPAESAGKAFEYLGLNAPDQTSKIDLILMDILMPEINGIEACRLLKATEHLRDIPIIMITGISDVENLEKAFAAGAMDYIVKPAKELELFARVGSSLKLKKETDKRKARERELMREIDKRRQVEEKLQVSNRELEEAIERAKQMASETRTAYIELNQIFNATANGMCVIDKDFNILRINETFSNLLGINKDEAVGKKCYDVLVWDLCKSSDCPLTRIVGGEERVEYDIEKKCHDAKMVPCILAATAFRNPDGEIIGIVKDLKDITDRKQAEKEQLYSEKLQGVLEMAGAVCHELNQPMQSISGYSELLLKNIPEDDKLYKKIKVIKEQIDRMKKITGNLAGITKYETKDYIEGIKIVDIDKSST